MVRKPNIGLMVLPINHNMNTWNTPHDIFILSNFGGNGNIDTQVQDGYNLTYVTSSKHICYARVMRLYLEVVIGAVKDFKIRKYNIWPLKSQALLLSTNL